MSAKMKNSVTTRFKKILPLKISHLFHGYNMELRKHFVADSKFRILKV